MRLSAKLGLRNHIGAMWSEPILLWEGLRALFAMRSRRGIYPASPYLVWRVATAYGSNKAAVTTSDMVHYLRWRRQMRGIAQWEQMK
jgi:hypothetical protein